MTTISNHLAEQMGLPHIVRDGKCFIQTASGEVEFDLTSETALSRAQRNMGFRAWADANGLPHDPTDAAIATGWSVDTAI